jgi:hypothetical protein
MITFTFVDKDRVGIIAFGSTVECCCLEFSVVTGHKLLGVKAAGSLGLTTLPPSCADCLEIWEPLPPGMLWACLGQ